MLSHCGAAVLMAFLAEIDAPSQVYVMGTASISGMGLEHTHTCIHTLYIDQITKLLFMIVI